MATYDLSGQDGANLDLSTEAGTNGNSYNTNDSIIGSPGDDTIVAGADDQVIVTTTNPAGKTQDHLVLDNDTITESSGDNTLTGGYGNDKFVFNINFDLDQVQHTETLAAPGQLSGANTNGVWSSYLDQLAAWRASMDTQHGDDEIANIDSSTYSYGAKAQQTRTVSYDNDYTWSEETVTTNTSTNQITDFGNGNDSIVLAGVTADQFAQYGHLTQGENGTVIQIGSFSITVLGVDVDTVFNNLTFA